MQPAILLALALLLAGCALPNGGDERPYYAELLSAAPFTDLVVEIDHAPGREPSLVAREHLVEELRNVTSKTRVSVRMEQTLRDDGTKRWSFDDLLALELQTRTTAHEAPVAVLHVLYPAGEFENDSVAGITISGNSRVPTIAVFLDTLAELNTPIGPTTPPRALGGEIERSTLLHEAGHAMGLVDNGLPMVRDHEDPAHEGHSDNEASVMFWRVETLAGIREALFHDGVVPTFFDVNDRNDMRSVGGR